MDVQPARLLRFGDFELDVRSGELRKHGVRIRLQDQSFQILLMLLERSGEVVLREEIRQKLWPNNTIVEFDHSINAAIKRLRNALGETAEEPRYIETLAKRGYRFVGQVTEERKDPPKAAGDPLPTVAMADADDLSGTTFSHFRVLEKLGTGGMGVVYRADDLKLGRQVALKFLQFPAEELPDSLLQRFEREARAASALNHPNICTVYSVDNFTGQPVIVMELVQGETLEARLARGRLRLDEAVALAVQIADALAEAHRKGIVHRDLKPGNVMLTKSGVKVLDFGLAKSSQDETLTGTHVVMGTPAYMAPEQREGKECDARTDIYALGLILYEMASGKRWQLDQPTPFDEFPPAFAHVVERCLQQDAEDRWQSAHDVQRELEWAATTISNASPMALVGGASVSAMRTLVPWGVAAVAMLGLASIAFLYFRQKPPAPVVPVRFQIPAPKNIEELGLFEVSPDGRKLAFAADGRLWVHSLESGESHDLTSSENGVPFWSPDSRFIGYITEGKIKRIEATGGPPQTVTDRPISWGAGAWNQDGVIVFADPRVGIFRVPASGGVPVQITALDPRRQENSHYGPFFLPDGRHFVYSRMSSNPKLRKSAIYIPAVGPMMAVEIATNPVFQAGKPRPLGVNPSGSWDAAADGKRFLVAAPKSSNEPITVVLNWQAGLKK